MIKRITWGPVTIAVICTLALILWLASGDVRQSRTDSDDHWEEDTEELASVQVEDLDATVFQPRIVVQGQVEPWQEVTLRSRLNATVESLPARLGQEVEPGDVLVELSRESRPQELERAESDLERAEADLRAAERLRGEDLASQSEYLSRRAEVSAAQAALREAELHMAQTRPEAPFGGLINEREIEKGDELQPGEPMIQVVDIDRLKMTGRVPQQKASDLHEGQQVSVELLDGRRMDGELSFIAGAANPDTRSFRVEAQVENPERLRVAGSSATLRIAQEPQLATRISPAYLNLNDEGQLGVKHVDGDDEVRFTPVRLLSADTDGAWVDGLPLRIRLITRGAGFVSEGQTVEPVPPSDPQGG